MSESPEYLDIDQMVELLPGQTRNAIYSSRHRGQAPGVLAVQIGKRLYWRRTDIERWFDERQALQRVPA